VSERAPLRRQLRPAVKYRQTLSFMVDVLDDGLRLYRRHFGRFVLLAATAFAPLALVALVVVWLGHAGTAEWVWALIAAWPLASLLLGVYWIGSLSRATVTALAGQPIDLRMALAIAPARALRGSMWAVLRGLRALAYYLVVAVAALAAWGALLFVIRVCLGVALGMAGAPRLLVDALSQWLLLLGGLGMLVIIAGMPLANIAFGLQPWFQDEQLPVAARKRGAEVWRDGDEDGMYFVAALAVLCLGVVMALSLIVLLALPVWHRSAPFVARGTAGALAATLLVLPLVPIWMALLYRKLSADADGGELGSRIAAWRSSIGATR